MHLDKIKGHAGDFNELEHVLDDVQQIGPGRSNCAKLNDESLFFDKLILLCPEGSTAADETQLSRELSKRSSIHLDIRPSHPFPRCREIRSSRASEPCERTKICGFTTGCKSPGRDSAVPHPRNWYRRGEDNRASLIVPSTVNLNQEFIMKTLDCHR